MKKILISFSVISIIVLTFLVGNNNDNKDVTFSLSKLKISTAQGWEWSDILPGNNYAYTSKMCHRTVKKDICVYAGIPPFLTKTCRTETVEEYYSITTCGGGKGDCLISSGC